MTLSYAYHEYVLDWCRNLVALIADNGTWSVPRSGLVFRANKPAKTLTLVAGDPGEPDVADCKRVFAEIGWTVVA